ncbi:glycosyltransferase [Halorubrum salinarum]|uniref:Glycosyltransferase n=1 Tax=Halorubrum salinarum TaxID=2739057 RepID=A0A7D3Y0L0_9EURY|nr:glycosyltransferase family 2 protein [Halorubrum salinarum]QKG92033.1 glycosyltransferase [Halorubrum salinarum]
MSESVTTVSIVTPAYNEEKYIEENILSVINQTYDNIEHIIIDDGSTDKTSDIIQRYAEQEHIRLISKDNEGQARAVNDGFELSEGEVVIWMNADDVLFYKETISKVVAFFNANPNVDIGYSNNAYINENSNIYKIRYSLPIFSEKWLVRRYFASCIFYRRSVIKNNKLDSNLYYALDYEYALRLSSKGYKFKHIGSCLWALRVHSETKSNEDSEAVRMEGNQIQAMYGKNYNYRYTLFRVYSTIINTMLAIYATFLIPQLDSADIAFKNYLESRSTILVGHLKRLPIISGIQSLKNT